jgi:muramidase (phage lysozyme)
MTLSLEGLRAFEKNPNVVAMLAVIAAKESGGAFDIINGGARFTDFSRHPYHGIPTTQGGRAAGCYQFLGTTWSRLCDRYEFPSFEPEFQTLGAIALIQGRGALDDVVAGRFEAAVAKLRPEWTSLPGASESRGDWTMDKARALYLERGGLLDNAKLLQPAAPIEDHSPTNLPPVQPPETPMPDDSPSFDWSALAKAGGAIASIFNPAIGLAISALSPLLQERITKVVGKHVDDPKVAQEIGKNLSDVVMETTKRVTGKSDDLEAVAIMRKDPALVAKVEAAVTSKLAEIAPFLDKVTELEARERADTLAAQDAAAARNRAEAWDMTPWLVGFMGGMVLLVVGFFGAVAIMDMVKNGKVATEVWAALTGVSGTLLGILGTIYAYRFASTAQSAAKNAIIGEIAARK